MDRRAFIGGFAGLLAPSFAAVEALPTGKVWRIGLLQEGPNRNLHPEAAVKRFVGGLRELGYVEGQNLVIEYRYTNNESERIPEFAAELARLKVDVIATSGTTETVAAKAATATIPIVMLFVGDPVEAGLVRSLTHPGAHVTGTSLMLPDLGGKRLALLREIVPKLRRVAILWNSGNASAAAEMRATETAARSLGLAVY